MKFSSRGPTHPDFSRLAWEAQRSGRKGAEALLILQDAVEQFYGPALEKALRHAKRDVKKNGYPVAILFAPTMERAILKYRAADTQRFYAGNHWPLVVSYTPHQSRPTAVVIWDSDSGRDVHYWADHRRRHGEVFR